MFNTKLIAIITNKRNGNFVKYEVMEVKYKIKDNILWITDHKGNIMDFDLAEFDIGIETIKQ